MVKHFEVESNELHEPPYYALAAYERKQGPLEKFMRKKQVIELLNDYSLQGNAKFYQAAEFLSRLKVDIIDKTHMFEIPLSNKSMTSL